MIQTELNNNTINTYFQKNQIDSYEQKKQSKTKSDQNQLTPEEQKQVDDLKKRDREVKAHERAHISAGGNYVRGGANYSYQRGPDGQLYAIGGEVSIDTTSERTPEETLRKAQTIRRAALAPAKPSSTDRAVAAKATRMEQQARIEIAKKSTEKQQENNYNQLGMLKNSFPSNNQPLSINILI